MADTDLGGAVIGATNTPQSVKDAAVRWMKRNGYSDQLEALGLVEPAHICPHCRRRPWVGNVGGSLCQRKPCQGARVKLEQEQAAGSD